MYSAQIIALAEQEIGDVLSQMSSQFTSHDFLNAFSAQHQRKYDAIVRCYMNRRTDYRHAKQRAHAMLMHTVNDRFRRLAHKVETIPNPNGGEMSLWRRG